MSELSPERSLSHSPLFQVMFALQNAPMAEVRLGEVAVAALEQETRSAKFDLFLDLSEQEGELVGVWEYSTDLFEAATVARMAEHFTVLLEGIADDPDAGDRAAAAAERGGAGAAAQLQCDGAAVSAGCDGWRRCLRRRRRRGRRRLRW